MPYLKGCFCLDDIPEEYIREFDGKHYVDFHIYKKRQGDSFERDGKRHTFSHYMVATPAEYGKRKKHVLAQVEERASPLDGNCTPYKKKEYKYKPKPPKQETPKVKPQIKVKPTPKPKRQPTYYIDDDEVF